MILIFHNAAMQYSEFKWLSVERGNGGFPIVRLVPSSTIVFVARTDDEASRFVAEVAKALKRGISCGAEWVDFSRLPGSVEYGSVSLVLEPKPETDAREFERAAIKSIQELRQKYPGFFGGWG